MPTIILDPQHTDDTVDLAILVQPMTHFTTRKLLVQ